jgi:hypothetical protein
VVCILIKRRRINILEFSLIIFSFIIKGIVTLLTLPFISFELGLINFIQLPEFNFITIVQLVLSAIISLMYIIMLFTFIKAFPKVMFQMNRDYKKAIATDDENFDEDKNLNRLKQKYYQDKLPSFLTRSKKLFDVVGYLLIPTSIWNIIIYRSLEETNLLNLWLW